MADIKDIIRTLWSSDELREDFKSNPKAFLEKRGQAVPENVSVVVSEDTPLLRHYVLPPEGLDLPPQIDPLAAVMRQASNNAGYREFAKSNPKDAVRASGGGPIPDSLEIKVLENSTDTLNLVIPVNPSTELSDADLTALTGGLEKASTNSIVCASVGGTTTVVCTAAAFTTPFALAGSAIAGTATTVSSVVADA